MKLKIIWMKTIRKLVIIMIKNKRIMAKEIGSYLIWAAGGVLVSFLLFRVVFGLACIYGSSMEPNYHNGNIVVFNRLDHTYQQGDVIVLRSGLLDGHNHKKHLIKRVIAVGGDTVSIVDGIVYVNGNPLEEDYINQDDFNMPERTVGDNDLFVLGDNRPNSNDSRYEAIGDIHMSDVDGVVLGDKYTKKG